MNKRSSIKKMFKEIRSYNGNFGDPIVSCVDFSPLELVNSNDTQLEIGAGIALLVEFCRHMDNSTYQDALEGKAADNLRTALSGKALRRYPEIFLALQAALDSETAFSSALERVCWEYVANA